MIAISGASGFIGQNLLRRFKEAEAKSISLRNETWADEMVSAETVINLIGAAHDHSGVLQESDFYYANLELVKKVFCVFQRSESIKLLIHVSSLAALEEIGSDRLLTEEDLCNPKSWYGQSKRASEEWLLQQKIPEGKTMIILRPPMVHGPGDKGNLRLLYNIISKGIPYPLNAFKNSRSLISIENFCFFVDEIIRKRSVLESGIYHVADDEAISTTDIVNLIKEVTNKKVVKLSIPKFIIRVIAALGDVLPIPLNNTRLSKLTTSLLVSNKKIKESLNIGSLPLSAKQGILETLRSFGKV